MPPDALLRCAQQRCIIPANPLSLSVALRWKEERRKAGSWASFSQGNRESPWLALNRSIAWGHMSAPRTRGVEFATDAAPTAPGGQYRSVRGNRAQAIPAEAALLSRP